MPIILLTILLTKKHHVNEILDNCESLHSFFVSAAIKTEKPLAVLIALHIKKAFFFWDRTKTIASAVTIITIDKMHFFVCFFLTFFYYSTR